MSTQAGSAGAKIAERYEVFDLTTGKAVGTFNPRRDGYWANKFVTVHDGWGISVAERAGNLGCRPTVTCRPHTERR